MRNEYVFEDTNFIYDTNFAGENREDDNYSNKDHRRFGNIIIEDPDLVAEMIADGFNVRKEKARPDDPDYVPSFFIKVNLGFIDDGYKYDPKKIGVLGEDGYITRLYADTVGQLDRKYQRGGHIRIKPNSVCCVARPYTKGDHPTLWINELYVEQDSENEHWSDRYRERP